MGNQFGYKKYMKKEAQKDHSLVKIFLISFFGMLLVFTFVIKSFSPSVDTSIGDYQQEAEVDTQEEPKKIVDDRLSMIQSEDQGRSFSELMAKPDDTAEVKETVQVNTVTPEPVQTVNETTVTPPTPQAEPVYKVFVGTYTSAEQAKVAKDIIQESGNGLNPIVKCIGSNNYTLQVGIFKNKQSAESLLYTVQQNHLPGRIVQDY
ncbi:TPA: hypothetical protein CPT90_04395 [Candidatus Gastranaerophilales bacterium HUM_3]|jgi:hypothetical protein|nr:hypothetical protein [bacterium]DAA84753.1 MAG TPA: hypothetical protein CPT90_04395 [Candidatus Gastranaerophilales bacterium HUM_3]DAA87694.1 MAG TPA: hypothetical protein CPT99_04180 [Candidatus Gastranaerophilales bacterium HUM_4]DAA89727.1 MAG TPA: hypothetical protein CPT87_08290 [Candidatus Gastranaerophilales bacterium HUM_5]DAA99126.1 MAG TPA: hypothetical protein CPT88_00235 [Candidatus Gastranaerophilales bacterium HUM_8]DAB05010.1 MAG TPA: hypothetical protein CPT89_00630 [Candi